MGFYFVLLGAHFGLCQLILLLFRLLLGLNFGIQRLLECCGQVDFPNAKRDQFQVAASKLLRQGRCDLTGNITTATGGNPFPAILSSNHRYLGAGVLAHHSIFDRLNARATPIFIERAGFVFDDLILDHHI